MTLDMLKCKIHRATVTEANVDYVGSITIDKALMDASGIIEYEKVSVVDVTTGARLETYVIEGEKNSGVVCLNGAAARLIDKGDVVIIMAYAHVDENKAGNHSPKVVFVDKNNFPISVKNYEKHGQIADIK